VQRAALCQVNTRGLASGFHELTTNIGGKLVIVQGKVINGEFRIATAWLK